VSKRVSKRLMLIVATGAALVGAGAGRTDAQAGTPAGTQFTLTGVMVVEGGGGRAWLQEPNLTQNQVITVRAGESIGAYRLVKIIEDRVELEGPTGKFQVMLAGVPAPATATTSPPRPAPVGIAGPAQASQAQPTAEKPPVDLRTDPRKKFDFGSLPSILNPSR
jgi:hypothetical protein